MVSTKSLYAKYISKNLYIYWDKIMRKKNDAWVCLPVNEIIVYAFENFAGKWFLWIFIGFLLSMYAL